MSLRSAISTPADGTVQIRWRSGRTHALAVSAVGVVVVLLYVAFGRGEFQPVHRMLMGLAAAAIAYAVAVKLTNVTRLSVRGESFRVEHGPLPWRSRLELPVAQVRRLYLDRKNGRLELRTVQGQEITVLDDLLVDAVTELDELIPRSLHIRPEGDA